MSETVKGRILRSSLGEHDQHERVSIGPRALIVWPAPDVSSVDNSQKAVLGRVGAECPPMDETFVAQLERFVEWYLPNHLVPLAASDVPSVRKWLSESNYPLWRQMQLLHTWLKLMQMYYLPGVHLPKWVFKVHAFIKREAYDTFKWARGIYSRSDAYKCCVGPIFKAIEEKVFKLPAFIKMVPVCDRPAYLEKMFEACGGKEKIATDYKKFEGSFSRRIMKACEFKLYAYMVKNLGEAGQTWLRMVTSTQGGRNKIEFASMLISMEAGRMSGEMCTSLGNGFTNLMIALFLCKLHGSDPDKLPIVVEGDDGLFCPEHECPTVEEYARLGFEIKLERHQVASLASFCGQLYDPTALDVITDPYKVLCNFGWSFSDQRMSSRLHASLVRAKADSLMAQFPGCPVVAVLGEHFQKLTASAPKIRPTYGGVYDYHQDEVVQKPRAIQSASRNLVEAKFGMCVQEQLAIEKHIRTLTLGPITDALINNCLVSHYGPGSDVVRYSLDCVTPIQVMKPDYVKPEFDRVWPRVSGPLATEN